MRYDGYRLKNTSWYFNDSLFFSNTKNKSERFFGRCFIIEFNKSLKEKQTKNQIDCISQSNLHKEWRFFVCSVSTCLTYSTNCSIGQIGLGHLTYISAINQWDKWIVVTLQPLHRTETEQRSQKISTRGKILNINWRYNDCIRHERTIETDNRKWALSTLWVYWDWNVKLLIVCCVCVEFLNDSIFQW